MTREGNRCTAYSDFDIALQIDKTDLDDINYRKMLGKFYFADGGTDIIDIDDVKDHRIESEIAKGVVVYER